VPGPTIGPWPNLTPNKCFERCVTWDIVLKDSKHWPYAGIWACQNVCGEHVSSIWTDVWARILTKVSGNKRKIRKGLLPCKVWVKWVALVEKYFWDGLEPADTVMMIHGKPPEIAPFRGYIRLPTRMLTQQSAGWKSPPVSSKIFPANLHL
jgi:hypothetical protein